MSSNNKISMYTRPKFKSYQKRFVKNIIAFERNFGNNTTVVSDNGFLQAPVNYGQSMCIFRLIKKKRKVKAYKNAHIFDKFNLGPDINSLIDSFAGRERYTRTSNKIWRENNPGLTQVKLKKTTLWLCKETQYDKLKIMYDTHFKTKNFKVLFCKKHRDLKNLTANLEENLKGYAALIIPWSSWDKCYPREKGYFIGNKNKRYLFERIICDKARTSGAQREIIIKETSSIPDAKFIWFKAQSYNHELEDMKFIQPKMFPKTKQKTVVTYDNHRIFNAKANLKTITSVTVKMHIPILPNPTPDEYNYRYFNHICSRAYSDRLTHKTILDNNAENRYGMGNFFIPVLVVTDMSPAIMKKEGKLKSLYHREAKQIVIIPDKKIPDKIKDIPRVCIHWHDLLFRDDIDLSRYGGLLIDASHMNYEQLQNKNSWIHNVLNTLMAWNRWETRTSAAYHIMVKDSILQQALKTKDTSILPDISKCLCRLDLYNNVWKYL